MFAPTLILNPSFVSDFSLAIRRNSFLWTVRRSCFATYAFCTSASGLMITTPSSPSMMMVSLFFTSP